MRQAEQGGSIAGGRFQFALLLVASLSLGGCAISEDLLELFASDPKNRPLCGILFDCDYRDRDQGRNNRDDEEEQEDSEPPANANPSTPSTPPASTPTDPS